MEAKTWFGHRRLKMRSLQNYENHSKRVSQNNSNPGLLTHTLQILRTDRDGMIDNVITLVMSFLMTSYCIFYQESTLSYNLGKPRLKLQSVYGNACKDGFFQSLEGK